jgi:hypothetical protein
MQQNKEYISYNKNSKTVTQIYIHGVDRHNFAFYYLT